MAISTTGSQVLYTGTNSPNQICPFPYIFFANTDLEVVTLDASNVSRTLILGTDYSVTGANNNSGGSVTLFLAVPTTTKISIVRNNTETQLLSLTTGDRFPASIMERALDKLTMLVQELSRAVSKSLRFSDVSAPQPDLLPLPASVLTTDTSSTLQFSSTSSATGNAPFFLAATTRGGQPTFQSIPTGAVGTTQIASGAVGSSQLATGAVGETQLATGAVTSTKIATGAVGTTQLVDSSVTSAKIATGAVGTTQLEDSSVTSAKLADSFVTTNTRQTITAEKVIQVLYETTSNTSISASVGNKSFVVGTGLNWVAGDQIQLLVRNTTLQWLRGSVLSYNTSTGAMTASITSNNIGGFGQSYNDWVVTHWAGGVPALRITSTDTAPALLVEDSTNPDTTPFTISSTGRVGIGVTPDASVCLSLDTTGVKFGDGTIQTTAGGGGGGGGVTSVAGTAPIASSGGTTPTISIATASSTTTGALSSTDWNTFNNKGAGTITSVTGTSPIASSGGATPTISIAAASTTGSGAVQLTDSTNSTSITTAATPNSVKTAFDLASGKVSKTGDTMTGSLVVAVNLNSPAVTITQTGLGEALRVEDNTTPDSTAFVVSTTGRVGIGNVPDSIAALHVDSGGIKFNDGTIQTTASTGGNPNLVTTDTRQTITGEKVIQALYETTSTTSVTIPTSVPVSRTFTGGTGLNWVNGRAVSIKAVASILTWNMRGSVTSYDSSTGVMVVNVTSTNGSIGISYNNWIITQLSTTALPALRITSNDSAPALLVEDSTNPDSTPFTISSTGRVGIGTTPHSSVCLALDSTGVSFNDGTIQTTAANLNVVTTDTPQTITASKEFRTFYTTTSNSSIDITPDDFNFGTLYVASGLSWMAGDLVRVESSSSLWFEGNVILYDKSTGYLEVSVTQSVGSGNSSSWNVTPLMTINPALTLTSTENASIFRVNDQNPDTTPFTISGAGRVGIGVTPDASVGLSLDSTGVKFADGTKQTTSYLPYVYEATDHFNSSTSILQLTGAAIAGGSFSYVNPTYNAFGIVRMETQNSTTANSGARMNQIGNTISFSPKGIGEFRQISRVMRMSADMFDGTIQGTFRTGIGDVINAIPNNGIYFQCVNSNSVSFITRNAGVETLTNTGFSILQDAWNSFEFILAANGLSVVAKINNNIVATHTTNIPNAYMGIISFLQKQVAIAGYVRFDFDFIYQKFTPTPIPFNP